MKTATNKYIPGVCNIGPSEIKKRRLAGWIGLIVAIVLLFLLIIMNAPRSARSLVFFPVALASIGFLQAYLHFCANFGIKGLFNFDRTDSVDQAEFRAKDQRKAIQIISSSLAIGLAIAITCVLL